MGFSLRGFIWEFPKIGDPKPQNKVPPFSETPIWDIPILILAYVLFWGLADGSSRGSEVSQGA